MSQRDIEQIDENKPEATNSEGFVSDTPETEASIVFKEQQQKHADG